MMSEPTTVNEPPKFMRCSQELLGLATTMTESAMDLKEKTVLAEKYVCYLRSLSVRTSRIVSAMHQTGNALLINAHKLTSSIKQMDTTPEPCFTVKLECDKLISVLEKEIAELDDFENIESSLALDCNKMSMANIAQKIKYFEEKQRGTESPGPPRTNSNRSFKTDIDEKYPESICRESLIDLQSLVALPPVPEDGRTLSSSLANGRSASLCSLKSFRKVKLMLQRADLRNAEENAQDSEDSQSETENNAAYNGNVSQLQVINNKGASLDNIQEEILFDL